MGDSTFKAYPLQNDYAMMSERSWKDCLEEGKRRDKKKKKTEKGDN